jgi:biotin transport system substrate-specific component
MPKNNSRPAAGRIALPALFAALCAAGAFISLPLPGNPVPLVAQNLLVVLSGLLLGPLSGALAVALFLLLGALGFPVFSGGRGGIALFAGPTGGYLAGYLAGAFIAGLLSQAPLGRSPARGGRSLVGCILGSAAGFLAILACGALRLKFLNNVSWGRAVGLGILPFLPGDGLKCALAALLAYKLGPFADRLLGRSAGARVAGKGGEA